MAGKAPHSWPSLHLLAVTGGVPFLEAIPVNLTKSLLPASALRTRGKKPGCISDSFVRNLKKLNVFHLLLTYKEFRTVPEPSARGLQK